MSEQVNPTDAVDEGRRKLMAEGMRAGRTYLVEKPLSEVRADLDAIAALDSEAEQNMGTAGCLMGCGVFLGIFGVMMLFATLVGIADSGESGAVPATILGVIALGMLIACGVMWVKGKRLKVEYAGLDIENRQYTTAREILRMVSADMASDATVSVRLDLSPHTAAAKQTDSGKVSYWNVDYFEDDWCDLSGQLLDSLFLSHHKSPY